MSAKELFCVCFHLPVTSWRDPVSSTTVLGITANLHNRDKIALCGLPEHNVLTSYIYAVGAYGTIVVCRLSVTDVLWPNDAR